jgi:hypothetical protein
MNLPHYHERISAIEMIGIVILGFTVSWHQTEILMELGSDMRTDIGFVLVLQLQHITQLRNKLQLLQYIRLVVSA